MTNDQIAEKLKELFQKFVKGVKDVKVIDGVVCVFTSSERAARNAQIDMCRCGAFSSVTIEKNNDAKGFVVNGVKK